MSCLKQSKKTVSLFLFFILLSGCSKDSEYKINGISKLNLDSYNQLLKELGADAQYYNNVQNFVNTDNRKGGVIFTGSSTIAIWNSVESDFTPLFVRNRGIGGSNLAQILIHGEQLIFFNEPETVVLYIGDNDAYYYDTTTFCRYMQLFLDNFKHRLPDIKLVLMSVKPSPSRSSNFNYYKTINKFIEEKADNKQIFFIDIWSAMYENNAEQYFQSDMLHLNRKGYELIIGKLKPLLQTINSEQNPKSLHIPVL